MSARSLAGEGVWYFQEKIRWKQQNAVPDPDLEIWRGGLPVIQTLRWGLGGGLQKNFFQPFGPQIGLKIRRGVAPPPPSRVPPLAVHVCGRFIIHGVLDRQRQRRPPLKFKKLVGKKGKADKMGQQYKFLHQSKAFSLFLDRLSYSKNKEPTI